MGGTFSSEPENKEEEATLAKSCSVEELQKCLKENNGDRFKCEKEIEQVRAHARAGFFRCRLVVALNGSM